MKFWESKGKTQEQPASLAGAAKEEQVFVFGGGEVKLRKKCVVFVYLFLRVGSCI